MEPTPLAAVYQPVSGRVMDGYGAICTEIKMRAERRAGELLAGMVRHEGGRLGEKLSHDETVFKLLGI